MGDIVERSCNAHADNTYVCYPVSASALVFRVRAEQRQAELCLHTTADHNGLAYTIRLHDLSAISEKYNLIKRARTPDLLSAEEWRQFWATWHGGRVRVGRAGDTAPFLEAKMTERAQIQFIMPAGVAGNRAQWQFELGPLRPRNVTRSVSGGEPGWVAVTDGVLPIGTLIGGHEEEPLHIIRAEHSGSLTPGKFVASEGAGYVSWGGEAHQKEEFEALVGYNVEWVAAAEGAVPVGAVPGGHAEHTRETLYVGRAPHDGHLLVGKVQRSHRVLYVPYQGREVAKSEYEVLVTGSEEQHRGVRFEGGDQHFPRPVIPNCGFIIPQRNCDARAYNTYVCYPVSASALIFQVRAEQRQAQLCLHTTADQNGLAYTILLQDLSAISEKHNLIKRASTPDLLSAEEWREFWATWHGGSVRVGRAGDTAPFLEAQMTERAQIQFIMPAGVAGHCAQWKFELGPVRPRNVTRSISGGKPRWVAATNGVFPIGTLIGGHEGEPLHIIRAKQSDSLMPGKFVPSEGAAYIAWAGEAVKMEEFEALVGYDVEWVAAAEGAVPVGAVPGGHVEHSHETLYVGRALHEGHLLVGRVQRSHRGLFVLYQGREIAKPVYEVLVTGSDEQHRGIRFDGGAQQLQRANIPAFGIINPRHYLEQQVIHQHNHNLFG